MVTTGDDSGERELVLVSGGDGRVGRGLVAALGGRFRVVGVDTEQQFEVVPGVPTLRPGGIGDGSSAAVLDPTHTAIGRRVAAFVHLAAEPDLRRADRLLRDLQADFEVEQFIFATAMSTDAPATGRSIRGRARLPAADLLRCARADLPVVPLRFGGIYTDAGDSPTLTTEILRILARPLGDERSAEDPTIGADSAGQAFVHLDDAIEAIVATILRRRQLPRDCVPIPISEPRTCSVERLRVEFARLLRGEQDWQTHEFPTALVQAVTWLQDRLTFDDLPDAAQGSGGVAPHSVDVRRAHDLIAWWPRHDLLETLPKIVRTLAHDPEGWARRHDLSLAPDPIGEVRSRRI